MKDSADPVMPNEVCNRDNKVECGIMSKAALRSREIKMQGLPESEERKMLSKVLSKAVSVE